MHVTIDEAGRLVIPKAIREGAGLLPGVQLEIQLVRGCIEILPAVTPTRVVDEDGVSVLVPEGGQAVTAEMVQAVQERVRGGG